ncbi:MAG: hypothetical protein GX178_01785 [Acidobacteria bacterium]|nr:hypothetical protein [Thermoanaerobaculia bacterium]NLN10321.1 hypothetical protein [Acidobacteriota bacterium]MBP7813036.1 hypothetical protein [Thermoanaerobaculia bacterium]HPA94806.1 hypothetical protein [Thermoanaerobaculia bacterium]HQN39997.1 hypothetical protein [Thermoanaerobaculia bacterium]
MSLLAGLLLSWIPLFGWGAHAELPWRAAREPRWRPLWRAGGIPLALAAGIAAFARLAANPDLALGESLASPFAMGGTGLLLLIALAAALGSDLLLAGGGERLPAAGWRLGALAGLLALGAFAIAAERLRTAPLPAAGPLAFAAGAVATAALGLAAAQVLTGPRRATALAGLLLPLHLLALPGRIWRQLLAGGDLLTAGAASVLLLAAPWLPPRLRRPAALAGSLLAALFLLRLDQLAALLPLRPVLAP